MNAAGLLGEAFGRIPAMVHEVLDGLSPEELTFRVDPEANSIAWLVWHMARIEDEAPFGLRLRRRRPARAPEAVGPCLSVPARKTVAS